MWNEIIMKNIRKKNSICLRIIAHYQNIIHMVRVVCEDRGEGEVGRG